MATTSARALFVAAALASFFPSPTFAGGQGNTWEVVGETGVSAQQFFVGGVNKIYVLDKVERNPLQINGGPAWATEYDLRTNTYRAMAVSSNSFCAGGSVLGNGTWLSAGGNKAVTWGGLDGVNLQAPYYDDDGARSIRLLDPCDNDDNCQWSVNPGGALMQAKRWYPTLETLEDGSIIIIGGCTDGGYVNDANQNVPTIEYYPSKGNAVGLNFLTTSLPTNLYALTWSLPSGLLFMQANFQTILFDWKNNVEYPLPDMPHAVRVYPASAATAMLPLTPANNYTATLLFCGGTNLQPDQWVTTWNIAAYPADNSCVKMTPDVSTTWEEEDYLLEGRVMGSFTIMPDGRLFLSEGISRGTAGYGNTSWAVGQAFGQDPIYAPAYFDPNAAQGSKWSRPMQNATVGRLYHSVATLLADGSIMTAGSNPNADYIAPNTPGYPYVTEYRAEKFYPDYYDKPRPQPTGVPDTLSYGGPYFNVSLPASSVANSSALDNTFLSVVRPGYATHAMNMGQRALFLENSYTMNEDGSAVLHVRQMPPNAALFPPGPAFLFVVVNGVPSNATMVMVGNGQLGQQTMQAAATLPGTVALKPTGSSSGGSDGGSGSGQTTSGKKSSASQLSLMGSLVMVVVAIGISFVGMTVA